MPTEWDDLLTVQEVQEAALSSSSAAEDNPNGVVEGAIRDVQDRIRTYIGMDPMVHRLKQGVKAHEWKSDDTLDPKKEVAWADHKPIVEVESPTDVGIRHENLRFTHEGHANLTVDYFAGWRRSDQTLKDLDGTNSGTLTKLDTEPSRLPDDIRRVAIKLVLFELSDLEHGAGIGTVTQAVGRGQQTTVEGTDTNFVRRHLQRLRAHRVSLY